MPMYDDQRDRTLVFVIGAPRSGTTWVQSMLGSHPAIATPQETDLFERYVRPLVESWDRQLHPPGDDDDAVRRKGLPLVLTRDEFDGAVREFTAVTFEAIARLKPDASVILEKSPSHSRCVDLILRVVPQARFIHVIRDGRDVVASLAAASSGWGSRFASSSIALGAKTWADHVREARTAQTAPGGYVELRYEDLLGPEAPKLLQHAFAVCGIDDVTLDDAATIVKEHDFDDMATGGRVADSILTAGETGDTPKARSEPEGFYRRGRVGTWRDDWSAHDRSTFAYVAGPLLIELGYEPDDSWVGGRVRPTIARRALHRAANTSARVLRGLADRVERLPLRGGSGLRKSG